MSCIALSEMVNESPVVELDFNQCTGPTANYVWSLERKHFFTIEQFVYQMKEKDTLNAHVPDLFSQGQRSTDVSCWVLCDGLRPLMNQQHMFTLDEQELLAPQLIDWVKKANRRARNEREGFYEQLERHVAQNPRKYSDEDQS